MEKDFKLDQSNALMKEGTLYDLHNFYDCAKVTLCGKHCLKMDFVPSKSRGIRQDSISIEFTDIDFLIFSPGFGTSDISELDEIGYKNPNDNDLDWLMSERDSAPADHLLFRFTGGHFLRVHSRRANLQVGSIQCGG